MADLYIKVNIPYTEQGFKDGNGEGVWVIVDAETKAIYDSNKNTENEVFRGVLDNDSVYYTKLKCGANVPFVMRGNNRPVVMLDYLKDKGRVSEQELIKTKERIALHHLGLLADD